MSEHEESASIDVPADARGKRSTSAFGRAVIADALSPIDPTGAAAAGREANWRSGYLSHLRRLVEAGLADPQVWQASARSGLDSIHQRMVVGDGTTAAWPSDPSAGSLHTVTVRGTAEPASDFVLTMGGQRLGQEDLDRQLSTWTERGVLEPGAADAVRRVAEHPEWLRADGHTFVALGAGSEMGPVRALLRWGATVAAVDLPRKQVWKRLSEAATARAGVMHAATMSGELDGAGVDLTSDVPALADWIAGLEGRVVLGNYVYADGAANLRVSAAVDALTQRVLADRADAALAFLATPTDVFVVPEEAVAHSLDAFEHRRSAAKIIGRPLRALSGGRLLARQYRPGSTGPGIHDALVPQQGPNYALAKRLQRWRATMEREEGRTVSMNIAPPTRTQSVVKNRALAAAYAGAHRFGVEVFEPATSNVLMAALLVHDLHVPMPTHEHPWQDEAAYAVHGGLWRSAYAPRSALGLAALLGLGSAQG